jgi:hypothetical protein
MTLLKNCFVSVVLFAVVCALAAQNLAKAADEAAPKVSTFAPAEDLANQAELYIKGLDKCVESADEYKDGQEKIAKDANTLIIIALALGLHDQDNKYKAPAGAIIKAAQALAATKDLDSAKKAIADVKAAAEGKRAAAGDLKWEKVASLPELMKQVPVINTKLKLNVKKLNKKAKEAAGYTAVLAAISQATMADTSVTKNADEVKKWEAFCIASRDDAGAVNAAIRKGDEAAVAKGMDKLLQSCEDCHAVFKPEAKVAETK